MARAAAPPPMGIYDVCRVAQLRCGGARRNGTAWRVCRVALRSPPRNESMDSAPASSLLRSETARGDYLHLPLGCTLDRIAHAHVSSELCGVVVWSVDRAVCGDPGRRCAVCRGPEDVLDRVGCVCHKPHGFSSILVASEAIGSSRTVHSTPRSLKVTVTTVHNGEVAVTRCTPSRAKYERFFYGRYTS